MTILPNGVASYDGGDCIDQWIMERGFCYDQMVKPEIIPLIKPGDWVIDGGAAIGDHTIAYLDAVGQTGKVFAFEPLSESFKCLKYNCPSAIHINRILWHERTSMFVSIVQQNRGGSHAHTEKPPDGIQFEGPLQTVVLDDYGLDRLDLIKLDIEGCEYFALQGAEQTIIRCRPKIVLEMNSGFAASRGYNAMHIYNLLTKWNYRWYSICGGSEPFCADCDIAAIPL